MSETRQAITEQADSFGVESLTEAEQQTLATPAPVEVAGFRLVRSETDYRTWFDEDRYSWWHEPKSYPAFGCEVEPYFLTYLYPDDIEAMGEALTGKRECDFCHRMRDDVTARVDPYAYEFSEEENVSQMCVDCYQDKKGDI